jgi:hypothetical protein
MSKKNSALTVSANSDNSITLSEEQKNELVAQQVGQMELILGTEDIMSISSKLSDNFISKRSLVINIKKEIKNYLLWLNSEEDRITEETKQEINQINIQHNKRMTSHMEVMGDYFERNTNAWQEIANHATSLFSIPTSSEE